MGTLEKFGFTDLKVKKLNAVDLELYVHISGSEVLKTSKIEDRLRNFLKKRIDLNPWEDLEGRKIFEFERVKKGEWKVKKLKELKEAYIDLNLLKQLQSKTSRFMLLYLFSQLISPSDREGLDRERIVKAFGIKPQAVWVYLRKVEEDINKKLPLEVFFLKEKEAEKIKYFLDLKDKNLVKNLGQVRKELDLKNYKPETALIEKLLEKVKTLNPTPPFEVQRKIASFFGSPEFAFLVSFWLLSVGDLDKEIYFYETINNLNFFDIKNFAYFEPIFGKDYQIVKQNQREFRILANKIFGIYFPDGSSFITKTIEKTLISFRQSGEWTAKDSLTFKQLIGYNFLTSIPFPLLTLTEVALLFNQIKGKLITKGLKVNRLEDLKRVSFKREEVKNES